jgi:anti-sigma factor RsiW
MSCRQVAEVIQRYLDNEIDDGTARRVTVHLERCDRCRIELRVYREIKDRLGRRATAAVDPAVLVALRRFCDQLAAGAIDPEPGGR